MIGSILLQFSHTRFYLGYSQRNCVRKKIADLCTVPLSIADIGLFSYTGSAEKNTRVQNTVLQQCCITVAEKMSMVHNELD